MIELHPDKLVWIGCAVSGLMAVFTATVALCTVNEATKNRSKLIFLGCEIGLTQPRTSLFGHLHRGSWLE